MTKLIIVTENLEEESKLNEGGGAGYSISGTGVIDSIKNIKLESIDTKNLIAKFTANITGTIDHISFSSYMYGDVIDDDIPFDAKTGVFYLDNLEDYTGEDEKINSQWIINDIKNI